MKGRVLTCIIAIPSELTVVLVLRMIFETNDSNSFIIIDTVNNTHPIIKEYSPYKIALYRLIYASAIHPNSG